MPTSIHSLLISLKITSSKLENILINCTIWTKYKRRKEGNLSPGSESVSYVMRDTGKNGKGRMNEGIEESSLDSLTFLLPSFLLALMLLWPEGPGSDAHHCLNLGISFSWPVSRSWIFLSCDIAFLACLFFPNCLTWILRSFQCHSSHNSVVTHSILWHYHPDYWSIC